MSEYQYYELQAVDRPLTEREMGEFCVRARLAQPSQAIRAVGYVIESDCEPV